MNDFFKFEIPVERVLLCAGFKTSTSCTES